MIMIPCRRGKPKYSQIVRAMMVGLGKCLYILYRDDRDVMRTIVFTENETKHIKDVLKEEGR